MGDAVSVSVLAPDPLLEAGIRASLGTSPELAVAAAAEPSQVTVLVVERLGSTELDTVRELGAAPHHEPVVVVTEVTAPELLDAIGAGARAVLRRRDLTADRLVRSVLTAVGGDCTVPPDLIDGLVQPPAGPLSGPPGKTHPTVAPWGLDERERAVLRLVADGFETEEIARELCYSPRTVTSVVRDITQRFGLRNRAHAVAYALWIGLL